MLLDYYRRLIRRLLSMAFTYRELKKKEEDDDLQLGTYLNKHSSR